MKHRAIKQVIQRASDARADSDFTFFFSQLVAAEALAKTIIAGMVAAISNDTDRNRYRLEHKLVHADSLGIWSEVIEDVVSGVASQSLLIEARNEQSQLSKRCSAGEWQYEATMAIKQALNHLEIEAEDVPAKTDLKRWFRLFTTLRNKTRGHGAPQHGLTGTAGKHIERSVKIIHENFVLFDRTWCYLHRNLSGKYRVSPITKGTEFNYLKLSNDIQLEDGVYVFFDAPKCVRLIQSDSELQDFYFPNGSLKNHTYELISYASSDRINGDATPYLTPPGTLPTSETEGHGELLPQGKCFSNVPKKSHTYVERTELETELKSLLLDDRRQIVTLVGRGGIGKTSLAIQVIHKLFNEERYEAIVWFSARDVDLSLQGPKPVRTGVFTSEDLSEFYSALVLSPEQIKRKEFKAKEFFEKQLEKCDIGPCLFVFDNFETMQNPVEMYKWIDAYIRLPNKALITTRLREFKADYPVEVSGMNEPESRKLITETANLLEISEFINEDYIQKLISTSEGHPYVIKILLGQVSKDGKAGNIEQIIVRSEDVLTALFERTYAVLSPCARRAFLTLSAWNSWVPELVLKIILSRSTNELSEVESGIESLLKFSIADIHTAEDMQSFISLPLVAKIFGKKKLKIDPGKAAIKSDVEILQMLGPSTATDFNIGLVSRLRKLIENISRKIDKGENYDDYRPILEAICQSYNPGWLLLARWHMEQGSKKNYFLAKDELKRFLENDPSPDEASEAWKLLGRVYAQTDDNFGEVHALIERAQIDASLPFYELSNTANTLNQFLKERKGMEKSEKFSLVDSIAPILRSRQNEADATDLSRMAWLEIHRGQESLAIDYVKSGLKIEVSNHHLLGLAHRLNIRR